MAYRTLAVPNVFAAKVSKYADSAVLIFEEF